MILRLLATFALLVVPTAGCDDDTTSVSEETTFEVSIENTSMLYDFSASGVFNTPVGAGAPAPILPGDAYEFSFSAAPGSKLSFATMFVHSNDFFYAPDAGGIELFDMSGAPVTGDVTSQIMLWDGGSEVNQEPGLGVDQAPRQSGPNTGAADPDNTVRIAPDDFNNLPAVDQVLQVTLSVAGQTDFTARIENVSTATTLMTSDGGMLSVPLAPGVWVVHGDDAPLFTVGQADYGDGLEALAEDGDPSSLGAALAAATGLTVPLSPGVWAVHTADAVLFTAGQADHGDGLEALAEDGDPSGLAAALAGQSGVVSSGAFTTPDGASMAGVILPGQSYSFTVTATPGAKLSLATMFVQSNDLFYAPDEEGIALFSMGGSPVSGDVTSQFMLWDAGTEVNQEPGIGLDQAPRQSAPDSGAEENGTVRLVNDGYTYPSVSDVIRVTVTPTM
ncbi:MAG: spondin domain-containing protein [Gemmatimonadota bacterium]|nr:MAG: spondin domain-containing protein [Gemmatimonadota bacterium]